MSCEPLVATPRTRRRTLGPQVARTAKQIGLTLLPWQKAVLATAMEQARGRPAYRDISISVPRQSGKSTLLLALIVWQMTERPGSTIIYGAQSRTAARRKMLLTWWPRLASSPLAGDLRLFRGFGSEEISHSNGSTLQLISAAESSGHGETVDLALIDESWVHQDAAAEQSLRPAMVTRKQAQMWAVSTAGTHKSVWWRARLDAGLAAAEMGVTDGTACFHWAAPEGANAAEPATWRAAMPALGTLADEDTIRADLSSMGVAEFSRAYLNLWPDQSDEGWELFARDDWEAGLIGD
jgi:phage terminase large subunit-like protein